MPQETQEKLGAKKSLPPMKNDISINQLSSKNPFTEHIGIESLGKIQPFHGSGIT